MAEGRVPAPLGGLRLFSLGARWTTSLPQERSGSHAGIPVPSARARASRYPRQGPNFSSSIRDTTRAAPALGSAYGEPAPPLPALEAPPSAAAMLTPGKWGGDCAVPPFRASLPWRLLSSVGTPGDFPPARRAAQAASPAFSEPAGAAVSESVFLPLFHPANIH